MSTEIKEHDHENSIELEFALNSGDVPYIMYYPETKTIVLDSSFTIDDLRAIINWMEQKISFSKK